MYIQPPLSVLVSRRLGARGARVRRDPASSLWSGYALRRCVCVHVVVLCARTGQREEGGHQAPVERGMQARDLPTQECAVGCSGGEGGGRALDTEDLSLCPHFHPPTPRKPGCRQGCSPCPVSLSCSPGSCRALAGRMLLVPGVQACVLLLWAGPACGSGTAALETSPATAGRALSHLLPVRPGAGRRRGT